VFEVQMSPDGRYYWDGQRWVPVYFWPPAIPQAVERIEQSPWGGITALAGSGIAAVGTLLPWVSLGFISANGIDTDDGKLAMGLALVGAALAGGVLAWRRRWLAIIGVLAALASLALVIYEIAHVASTNVNAFGSSEHLNPGSGLYLGAIGSVVATIGFVMATSRRSVAS
jgi:hypothetical protein